MITMSKINKEQDSITNKKILAELRKHSNISIETIAKHCGVARQKVYRILKQLEEKRMIWGYTAIIDEEKQGLQKFLLLLKRSNQPLKKEIADSIATGQLDRVFLDLGITIESNYYLHGEYDWAVVFTAQDLRNVKKFSDVLIQHYPGVISKTILTQILFSQREHYIVNPNPMRLGGFI